MLTIHRDAARALLALVAAGSVLVSCGPADGTVEAEAGAPLPGLTDAERDRFRAGRALFDRVFTAEDGLGPFFNENQCSACHTDPASGGTGEQRLVRAARIDESGRCDPLAEVGGGNVRQRTTAALHGTGVERESVPAEATVTGRYLVPFLYGLGLVEAIPEETILERADPGDADGDEISGRVGRDSAGRLARFGQKAERATIGGFVDQAIRGEMGLTTPSAPDEARAGGPASADADPAPEPEVGRDLLDLLTDYVRFLAPPRRIELEDNGARERVWEGERLFHAIGCVDCHVPAMRTGRHDSPALDGKQVYLYSDLLLHDMGPGLADVCGADAGPSELRTAPLMGLSRRSRYLHDGRTTRLEDAVREHGGEGTAARTAFEALPPLRRHALIRFLETL